MSILWEYFIRKVLAVSSLTTPETLMLNSTFDLMVGGGKDCEAELDRIYESIASRVKDLKQIEPRLDEYRNSRGCEGRILKVDTAVYAPFRLKTCPCNFQNRTLFSDFWTMFDAFDRHGILPYTGPLLEQPAKVMEGFRLLKSLKTKLENEQVKKANKKNTPKTRRS